ncbi:sulfite exporter TauE/SafE family protein [Demequina sp. SYSU T00039]|uniref:Probable membrane transporter protein n=1 Tax=Demequina lignilytica TaxID=3051663 RepID=A0AAW7M2T6_9MICO|nr:MULTISPECIES: sulfite exporter TauE/SafE family protein [unclassified Demequina]MDN4477768.1 sulfite exporter TauE/SafE family protein [Demequina sp. SYSU T00039-1]MDN4487677.1 sulfite exporter TauE/SafE family protein [Demequina sp. SYSU T00039]MDN4491388.1 sulfite exporter TauE/SafE family protein [Demequina sp. SYSU T00068]
MLPEQSVAAWVLLAVAAAVVGVSKTALPGASTLSIAAFAAVLPARQSTGTLLALLIVGDVFALWAYRRHADWRALVRLAPAVIVGVLAGVAFLALADDAAVRRLIGVILLLLIAFTLWRRRVAAQDRPHGGRILYGTLGGFTTMVANAGGPVMSMYFLAARLPVKTFLGTAAWFFAIVNVAKVPFSISLGLLTPAGVLLDLVLVPAVLVGALAGRALAERIDQTVFDRVVIALTLVGAVYLLI